jgi:hypothetical protein
VFGLTWWGIHCISKKMGCKPYQISGEDVGKTVFGIGVDHCGYDVSEPYWQTGSYLYYQDGRIYTTWGNYLGGNTSGLLQNQRTNRREGVLGQSFRRLRAFI